MLVYNLSMGELLLLYLGAVIMSKHALPSKQHTLFAAVMGLLYLLIFLCEVLDV